MTALGTLLEEVQPGFACGREDREGVFQFRMHNVSKTSDIKLDKRRRVPANAHKRMDHFLVRAGDVLFNATNSPEGVGKSVLVPVLNEPAVFSNHFLRLRTDTNRLHAGYLWRWLQMQYGRGVFLGMTRRWVNQATVSRDDLLALDVPLPSLDEQRRIAAILDHADDLRSKRRQVLAHLDSLTQSTFHVMFAGCAWAMEPLSAVVQADTIVTYGIVQAGEEFQGGVPYIRTGDIVAGEIVTAGLRHTDPAIAARFQRSAVSAGDIVMSIRATVGTTAIVPSALDGANLTQGTARIAPSNRAIGPYLLGYLRSDHAQRWIHAQVKGATFREITLARLRELPVPLPPATRQRQFAERSTWVNSQTAHARRAMDVDDQLFASLQARAFRGEL